MLATFVTGFEYRDEYQNKYSGNISIKPETMFSFTRVRKCTVPPTAYPEAVDWSNRAVSYVLLNSCSFLPAMTQKYPMIKTRTKTTRLSTGTAYSRHRNNRSMSRAFGNNRHFHRFETMVSSLLEKNVKIMRLKVEYDFDQVDTIPAPQDPEPAEKEIQIAVKRVTVTYCHRA